MSILDPDNATTLVDFRTYEYILLGDLRDVLNEELDEVSRTWTLALLDALLSTLPQELDMAESGKYLNMDRSQHRSQRASFEKLLNEKHLLYAKLRHLHSQLRNETAWQETAEMLKHEIHTWMKNLVAHHRNERALACRLATAS